MADITGFVDLFLPDGTLRVANAPNAVRASVRYDQLLSALPIIRRALSDGFHGFIDDDEFLVELAAMVIPDGGSANPLAVRFRAIEARTSRVVYTERHELSGAEAERFAGTIQQIGYSQDAVIRVRVASLFSEVLDAEYPRVLVTPALFPSITDEGFDVDAPLALHFGAHREHTPCRLVESNQAAKRIRYVVGCDLIAAAGGYQAVRPWPTTLYRGASTAVLVVPPGEYEPVWNPLVADIPLPTCVGQTTLGGSLTPGQQYRYLIVGDTGCGYTAVPALGTLVTLAGGQNAVQLTWEMRWGLRSYRIYREHTSIGLSAFHCATVPHGMATGVATPTMTWVDDGNGDGDGGQPPLVNTTGTHTVEALFEKPQSVESDAPAPILADVEATELGLAPSTRALYLFRETVQDLSPFSNWPIRSDVRACWLFRPGSEFTVSETANNALTGVGMGTGHQVVGPLAGKSACRFNRGNYFTIAHGAQTGLDPGTGDFRVDVWFRADPGTVDRTFVGLMAKRWLLTTGWELGIASGRICGRVRPVGAVADVVAVGGTKLDGAWHRAALVINRSLHTLSVEVDGTTEATVSIGSTASISNSDQVTVGFSGVADSEFAGEMAFLQVSTDILIPSYLTGKSGTSLSAYRCGVQAPLYVPHARQRGLDVSNDSFFIDASIRLAVAGQQHNICRKIGATAGWAVILNSSSQLNMTIRIAGVTYALTDFTTPIPVDGRFHHIGVDVIRGASAVIRLYVDGALVTSAWPGPVDTSPGSLDNSAEFIIGASGTTASPTSDLQGWIDELRIVTRTQGTAAQHRAVGYLMARNPVRQMRQLLESVPHGPGLTVDATTWDAAEAQIAALALPSPLVTDGALVERRPLRDALRDWTIVRGMRLAMNSAGALEVAVDTQQAPSFFLQFRDGNVNTTAQRPLWTERALRELAKVLRVKYRRRRRGTGEVDRYLMAASDRTVSAVGLAEPEELLLSMVRDRRTADVVADYVAKRKALRDVTVEVPAGEVARTIGIASVGTIADPTSGMPGQAVEVFKYEAQGSRVDLAAALWDASIYTYAAGTLPADLAPENRPDYSATPPSPVSNVVAQFLPSATVLATGEHLWTLVVSWTNPSGSNLQDVIVEWSPTGLGVWQRFGAAAVPPVTEQQETNRVWDDSTVYDVRVSARNRSGLYSIPVIVTATTTVPGAPVAPSGMQAIGSGVRTKRWRWNKGTEKDLDGYEYQVWTASGRTGTQKEPASGVGFVRGTQLAYTESGMTNTAIRYLSIRARNKAGQVSAWTELASASSDGVGGSAGGGDVTTGTIGTTDVLGGEIAVLYNTNEGDVVSGSVQSGPFNGGTEYSVGGLAGIVVPSGSSGVLIVVNFELAITGWPANGQLFAVLRRGATLVGQRRLWGVTSGGSPITVLDGRSAWTKTWIDKPGNGTHTYNLYVTAANMTGLTTYTPFFQIAVLKR